MTKKYLKYKATSDRYRMLHREVLNAKKRAKRLEARKEALRGKHCLNCEILLEERLSDSGRSYLYCRKCITEYKSEYVNHKCRRSYYAKRKRPMKVASSHVSEDSFAEKLRSIRGCRRT